ncbi:hypothetical protein LguiA_017604 [Lonicera macranthoides]
MTKRSLRTKMVEIMLIIHCGRSKMIAMMELEMYAKELYNNDMLSSGDDDEEEGTDDDKCRHSLSFDNPFPE